MAKTITEKKEFWITRDTVYSDDEENGRFGGNTSVVMFWNKKPSVDDEGNFGIADGDDEDYGHDVDPDCDDFERIMRHIGVNVTEGCSVHVVTEVQRPETAKDRAEKALKSTSTNVKNAALKELIAAM